MGQVETIMGEPVGRTQQDAEQFLTQMLNGMDKSNMRPKLKKEGIQQYYIEPPQALAFVEVLSAGDAFLPIEPGSRGAADYAGKAN